MQGNLHVPFLGGWAGAIPPGYPADEETYRKARVLSLPNGNLLIFQRLWQSIFGHPFR